MKIYRNSGYWIIFSFDLKMNIQSEYLFSNSFEMKKNIFHHIKKLIIIENEIIFFVWQKNGIERNQISLIC